MDLLLLSFHLLLRVCLGSHYQLFSCVKHCHLVGFDKPYKLAKAIIESEGITVNDKIMKGSNAIGGRLIADYVIEITILALGGLSGNSDILFQH